jgi:predicted nucleotidyltransferase
MWRFLLAKQRKQLIIPKGIYVSVSVFTKELPLLANQDPIILEFATTVETKAGSELRQVILFGSRSRGEATQGSDYDYIVVVGKRRAELEEAVLDVAVDMLDRYGILVSPHIYSEVEWEEEKEMPLGINVLKEGVLLWQRRESK